MAFVVDLPPKKPLQGEIPTHWLNKRATRFQNPWESWCSYPPQSRILPYLTFTAMNPTYPDPGKVSLAPVRTPRWGEDQKEEMKAKIKSTWLGHACFLLELPAQSTEPRGARILFDPVFSKRCSSSQLVGPKRYTPAPCKIEDIPDLDAIVISHDHYDHMDADTLKNIFKRERKPLVFAPLGNTPFLKSVRAPEKNIHVMDWWQSKHVEIEIPSSHEPVILSFDITCTPCQHFTGRHLFDDFTTLWSSWVIQSPSPPQSNGTAESDKIPTTTAVNNGVKVYFAGDTGYRTVKEGEDENKVPTCPAFKEIGDVFGGFDFAMIPIGAYQPRKVMSPIHCAPQDSVRIFQDVRARKALGMHWGTWVLTTEAVDEPPKKLAEERKKAGIPDDDFVVCDIGETRFW